MIKTGIFLEAEVPPSGQSIFESRYHAATGVRVSPGSPGCYQSQKNKWGPELRGYFNDIELVKILERRGVAVEGPRTGYKSGDYKYRFNHNDTWWELVEKEGLRLGMN